MPDHLIGHAIEGHATGKAQIIERHFAVEAPNKCPDSRICGHLQCRRDIGMSLQNLRIGVPWRAEQILQSTRFSGEKSNRLRVYRVIFAAEPHD